MLDGGGGGVAMHQLRAYVRRRVDGGGLCGVHVVR